MLYDGNCQTASIRVLPGKTAWQVLALSLIGPALVDGPWYAPRLAIFFIPVVNPGGVVDFDNIRLIAQQGQSLLVNGNFSKGLAQWFPAAQSYFLPWHMCDLFLEVMLERGVTGLLLLAALMAYAVWHLVWGRAKSLPLSRFLAAALCAAWLVGLVSSLLEVPGVAFLLYLLTLFSIQTAQEVE